MNSLSKLQAEHHPSISAGDIRSAPQLALFLAHEYDYRIAANELRGLKVLDLGCNSGYGTAILSESCDVIGADVSEKSLGDARRRYPHLDFRLSSSDRIDFPDQAFDAIVVHQVIEHLTDPLPFLNELNRMLVSGGRVVVTTPNAKTRLDGAPPWNPFHAVEYTPDELNHLLSSVFRSVTLSGLRAHPFVDALERERFARRREEAWIVRRLETTLNELMKDERFAVYEHSARLWVHLHNRNAPTENVDELHRLKEEGNMFHYSERDIDNSLSLRAVCWS